MGFLCLHVLQSETSKELNFSLLTPHGLFALALETEEMKRLKSKEVKNAILHGFLLLYLSKRSRNDFKMC